MAKQQEQRVEAFSLRIDEIRLLNGYRQLAPHDRESMILATEKYLSEIQPKRVGKPGGDHQYGGSA